MNRLSVGKVRVKAQLEHPDYVPKKEFGFRTINSPHRFTDISLSQVDPGQHTDDQWKGQAGGGKARAFDNAVASVGSLESILAPDPFLKSQKVQPLINQVQHESPSGKFHTKLLEREKERQMAQMEARVRKLEIDRSRADRQLQKTLDAHDAAEAANKRKRDDLDSKQDWLRTKHEMLEQQRQLNTKLREERKQNVHSQRQRVLLENIMSRDQQKQELQHLNVGHAEESRQQQLQRDAMAAQMYQAKSTASKQHIQNFTQDLVSVRNRCEQRSLRSLQECDNM